MKYFYEKGQFYNGSVCDKEEMMMYREMAEKTLDEYRRNQSEAQSMFPGEDGLQLEALKETLRQFEINPKRYSLMDQDGEGTICLNFVKGAWSIYSCERGQRHFLQPYPTFDLAALDLIWYMVEEPEGQDQMCYFYHMLSAAMSDLASEKNRNNAEGL